MNKSFLREVAEKYPQEILQPYDALMGLDGFDVIFELTEQFGGTPFYVPCARTIFSRCLEAEAKKEIVGKSIINVARKYGYTARHLRRIATRA